MDGGSINPILDYIQKLPLTKQTLPFGQPVCVATSHRIKNTAQLIQLAAELGPYIALLQVHVDNIEDWGQDTIDQLTYQAKKHAFILWEGSRILNSTVNMMGRGAAHHDASLALADSINIKYTNGLMKTAQWAGMAICFAAGVPYDQQDNDLLLPSLRKAARQAVATTTKTIQTEISVQECDPNTIPEEEQAPYSPPTTNGWHEFSSENVGYALRKSSTISVTESITVKPDVQPDDGVAPPPLLARGMTLYLPSSRHSAFTPEYRQCTLAAACANSDFVVGFTTTEPFFPNYRGNTLLELASEDGHGSYDSEGDSLLKYSPYMDMDTPLALFSLIPPDLMRGYHEDLDQVINGTFSPRDSQSQNVSKLFYVLGRALKLREINRKEHGLPEDPSHPTGPKMFHIPVVAI